MQLPVNHSILRSMPCPHRTPEKPIQYANGQEFPLVQHIGELRVKLTQIAPRYRELSGEGVDRILNSVTLLCDYLKDEFQSEEAFFDGNPADYQQFFADRALTESQLKIYASGMEQRRMNGELYPAHYDEHLDNGETSLLDSGEYVCFPLIIEALAFHQKFATQGVRPRRLF